MRAPGHRLVCGGQAGRLDLRRSLAARGRRGVASPTQVPLHGGQRATETVCDEAQWLVGVSLTEADDVLGGHLMPASDDPGEGFEVVGTNPNPQAGANARTLTRGCASSESRDVVVEDGVLKALFEEAARARACRVRSRRCSSGVAAVLSPSSKGCWKTVLRLAQDGRAQSFVRFTMAPFQWAKAACFNVNGGDVTSAFRASI